LFLLLDEQVLNKISCFAANGTKEDLVDVQHTVPDITSFQVINKIFIFYCNFIYLELRPR
jgi:hypothetical protein